MLQPQEKARSEAYSITYRKGSPPLALHRQSTTIDRRQSLEIDGGLFAAGANDVVEYEAVFLACAVWGND